MPGMAGVALNMAPIFGGVPVAVAAGQLKAPDYRSTIKQGLDLLDRLPAKKTARHAAVQSMIEQRIDDLIEADDRSRELRAAVISFQGGWQSDRDTT
jgi:serine protease inhibitor